MFLSATFGPKLFRYPQVLYHQSGYRCYLLYQLPFQKSYFLTIYFFRRVIISQLCFLFTATLPIYQLVVIQIIEAIKTISNLFIDFFFFFYEKISHAQKSTKSKQTISIPLKGFERAKNRSLQQQAFCSLIFAPLFCVCLLVFLWV